MAESERVIQRMGGEEHPFRGFENVEGTPVITDHLSTLGLNFDSTVENVRGVAVSTRLRDANKGTTRFERDSLFWALQQTGDCTNPREFELFFNRGNSFEQIETQRAPVDGNEKPFETALRNLSPQAQARAVDYLSRINCEFTDTADEIRRRAMVAKYNIHKTDENALSNLQALRWILEVTGDCPTPESFLKFVFTEED